MLFFNSTKNLLVLIIHVIETPKIRGQKLYFPDYITKHHSMKSEHRQV